MPKKITYTCYVGGKQVDKLTPEQVESMAARIGEAMSIYYAAHPDEYKALLAGNKSGKSGTSTQRII